MSRFLANFFRSLIDRLHDGDKLYSHLDPDLRTEFWKLGLGAFLRGGVGAKGWRQRAGLNQNGSFFICYVLAMCN